jgi:hypothetical protein
MSDFRQGLTQDVTPITLRLKNEEKESVFVVVEITVDNHAHEPGMFFHAETT